MIKNRNTDVSQVEASNKRKRIRELGVEIGRHQTGRRNAITDVAGVRVGHRTVISGEGALVPGKGPVRTGVTVVIPHTEDIFHNRVSAGSYVINGNGMVTGLDWIAESGALEGPIALTGTHSVGDVHKGLVQWMIKKYPTVGITEDTYLPVVGECDDSPLSDSHGFHVLPQYVSEAIADAYQSKGEVKEGAVGAGTGLTCYEFKGGIGTASRVLSEEEGAFTVGALVNCNQGLRKHLIVAGVPVGRLLSEKRATLVKDRSIVIVIATDAPMSSRQLNSLSKRAAMGLVRTGCIARPTSGEFVISFSTTSCLKRNPEEKVIAVSELADKYLDVVYEAAIEATEEAIINALCMAETIVGRDGNVSPAMPLAEILEILKRYGKVKTTANSSDKTRLAVGRNGKLRVIPENAIKVDFVPEVQQPDDYSCGTGVTMSVALPYEIAPEGKDDGAIFAALKEALKTSSEHGTYYGNIAEFLKPLDAAVEHGITRERLKDCLDKRMPVIVSIQAYANDPQVYDNPDNNDNGHFVIAVGYDDEGYFYFRDPSLRGRYGFLAWDELDRRWHENEGVGETEISHHLGIVIKSPLCQEMTARWID